MAKKITERERLAFKLDALTDGEIKEVAEYISIMETMRRAKNARASASSAPREDELISSLADSRENRRAQQTFEWENARRRADRRHQATSSAARA